jgi:hypothetical protein
MQDTGTEIDSEQPYGLDAEAMNAASLNASLASAKVRFNQPDLAATPALTPVVSDQARELQQLRAQLFDAERSALRAQKAASDYRDQLTEAQADIANMKARWYASEKARNAVTSKRDVDSSSANTQLAKVQRELERTQQMAASDMERAAGRIRALEERLELALRNQAVAESSQLRSRKRSNLTLGLGISIAAVFAALLIYEKLPHSSSAEPAVLDSSPVSPSTARRTSAPNRGFQTVQLQSLGQKPFVPKVSTKSLPDALGNLDRALKALPGLDPEEVIKQVRKRQSTPGRPVCQFDWADGGPSMVFDQKQKGASMENWALAISRCADAVNQAH